MPNDWKHGWIPLTAKAARQKNHGSKPGPGSAVSKQMDTAIRAKTGRASSGDDIHAATAAIKAGDHAHAVNLLSRAMKNAKTPQERAAIKKQRDALARKIMGR
jgi:hypothetical protein